MGRIEYGVDAGGKEGDESGKGVLCAPTDKAENFLPISYIDRRPSDSAAGKRSEKNEKARTGKTLPDFLCCVDVRRAIRRRWVGAQKRDNANKLYNRWN